MSTILIVEDDHLTLQGLIDVLESHGHAVLPAPSAEAAMDMLTQSPPDVALLDLHLPGASGDDFAAILKLRCPDTRLIFISADLSLPHPGRFIGSWIAFHQKPLLIDTLLAEIDASSRAPAA